MLDMLKNKMLLLLSGLLVGVVCLTLILIKINNMPIQQNTSFTKQQYIESIITKIESNKKYPTNEKNRNHEGIVKINFTVLKDGTIQNPKILTKSNFQKLDNAALETIKNSSPFTKFPKEITADKIPITLELVYKID
ncbi:energy transducer TonB [Candidatus Margulisiibacteriota bacterium]